MNGLGNDFVIVAGDRAPSAAQVRAIADRRTGVGCDQFIMLGPSLRGDVAMRIWNPDGSRSERCGNAERCVAWLTMKSRGRSDAVLESGDRLSYAKASADARHVTVDMGATRPRLAETFPLAWEMDTRRIQLRLGDQAWSRRAASPWAIRMSSSSCLTPKAAPAATDGADRREALAVPQASQRRLRPDSRRVLAHPAAGVGARRRPDPGLRHRRLRGPRRRAPARPDRPLRDDDPRRRRRFSVEWREADDHVLMTGPVAVEFTGRLARYGVAVMSGHPAFARRKHGGRSPAPPTASASRCRDALAALWA